MDARARKTGGEAGASEAMRKYEEDEKTGIGLFGGSGWSIGFRIYCSKNVVSRNDECVDS